MDLHAAAERLGVHYQTAYRWVRTGELPAVKRGQTYDITEADVERFDDLRRTPALPPRAARVRSWSTYRTRFHDALVAGDEPAARHLLDHLRESGVGPVDLIEQLIAASLQRIGDEWASGRLGIAVEHRAAAMCESLLPRIAVHPRGRPRGIAIVTTAPGDDHGLAASMAAVALRADRWQVHHLNPGVPVEELADMAARLGAEVVVLSVTFAGAKADAEYAAEVLASRVPKVLVGEAGHPVSALLSAARPGR